MSPRRAIVAAALALFAGTGQAQTFSDTGPDAEGYGAKDGYPVPIGIPGALREQRYLVGRHSNYERLVRTRAVPRAAAVWHFKRAAEPLALDYRAPGGERSIAAYLAIHPTTGLLIVKGDTILFEHYQYARTDRDRFLSNSMAKTVIALLVGIALEEGRIRSIDDPVEAYVPGLRGKEYGGTTLRALLHMSSGVAFREEYDGTDDISRMAQGLARVAAGGQAAVIGQFDRRVAPRDPTLYLCITSKTDPEHAPAGHENWFVLVNAPFLSPNFDWSSEADRYAQHIRGLLIANLGRVIPLAEPQAMVQVERRFTPLDLQETYGGHRGAIYGFSSNTRTMAFMRPGNRDRAIARLYYAGGSVHPGGGVPLVALSGLAAAECLVQDLRP